MHLIQKDLYKLVLEWNTHRIRSSRGSTLPSGHPDEYFYMPQIYGMAISGGTIAIDLVIPYPRALPHVPHACQNMSKNSSSCIQYFSS